jgi:hypothetical protein
MRFRALETFDSVELKSTYVKGLMYTVRPGDYLLAALVTDWLDEKKVERIDNFVEPQVHISGLGKVE